MLFAVVRRVCCHLFFLQKAPKTEESPSQTCRIPIILYIKSHCVFSLSEIVGYMEPLSAVFLEIREIPGKFRASDFSAFSKNARESF